MHALSYTHYMPERVYVTTMRLRCIGGSADRYEKWVDGNLDSVTGRRSACVLWSLCDKVTRLMQTAGFVRQLGHFGLGKGRNQGRDQTFPIKYVAFSKPLIRNPTF